jgi:hypothetical protein
MEFPLFNGSMKAKHAIDYTFSKNACTILSRAKRDTIWIKPQKGQEVTQRCEKIKVLQIISKRQINTRLTPKFNK